MTPAGEMPALNGSRNSLGMIVIKATGSNDVKSLKKLARSLSAEPADISVEDLAPPPNAARTSSNPSVSTLAGASIAPATRAAIMGLAAQSEEEGRLSERWSMVD